MPVDLHFLLVCFVSNNHTIQKTKSVYHSDDTRSKHDLHKYIKILFKHKIYNKSTLHAALVTGNMTKKQKRIATPYRIFFFNNL